MRFSATFLGLLLTINTAVWAEETATPASGNGGQTAPTTQAPLYNPALATAPNPTNATPKPSPQKAPTPAPVKATTPTQHKPATTTVKSPSNTPKSTTTATSNPTAKLDTKSSTDKTKLTATQVAISKESYDHYQSLEKNNLATIAQNQELQIKNDNLVGQVQVLENERTAQLLIYGAMILLMGGVFGFLIGYFFARRQRPYL